MSAHLSHLPTAFFGVHDPGSGVFLTLILFYWPYSYSRVGIKLSKLWRSQQLCCTWGLGPTSQVIAAATSPKMLAPCAVARGGSGAAPFGRWGAAGPGTSRCPARRNPWRHSGPPCRMSISPGWELGWAKLEERYMLHFYMLIDVVDWDDWMT